MYTTIIHPLRKAYSLSIHEYCILDSLYMLSHNKKYGGWCVASKKTIAKELDLSERTAFNIIETLIKKGLVEKSEAGFLRTVDEWNELIANKHDYIIAFNGKESQLLSGTLRTQAKKAPDYAKIADTMQKLPNGMQKLQGNYAKIADNNIQDNNIDNNIVSKDTSEQGSQAYGNTELNKLLEALKGKIGVEDFKESHKQQRIWLHNLYQLMLKIQPKEFSRRLDIILKDQFKHKNCGGLQFIYREVKGFIEPKPQGRGVTIIS